jgi:adenine phosphoribosyltransferase
VTRKIRVRVGTNFVNPSKLLRQISAHVVAACFIIDLPDLGGAAKLRAMDVPVRTLMTFEGH